MYRPPRSRRSSSARRRRRNPAPAGLRPRPTDTRQAPGSVACHPDRNRWRGAFVHLDGQIARTGWRTAAVSRHSLRTNDPWIERISLACGYLEDVERGHLSLAKLARRIGGSPYHLQRNFKRIVGVTPREYADACRLRTVKRRLRESDAVTAAVFDAGYGSSSRFYERAAPKLGMSPTTYRRGGAGMSIRYAIVDSCLGRLLVAATARGVCSVAMGKSDRDLEWVVADEFPAASIARDDGGLARWTRAIAAYLDGRRPAARSADRCPGHLVSVAGVESPCGYSPRRDANLCRGRDGDRTAACGPSGWPCVCGKQSGHSDSVSSRRADVRRGGQLPVGRRAEEGAAGARTLRSHRIMSTIGSK